MRRRWCSFFLLALSSSSCSASSQALAGSPDGNLLSREPLLIIFRYIAATDLAFGILSMSAISSLVSSSGTDRRKITSSGNFFNISLSAIILK